MSGWRSATGSPDLTRRWAVCPPHLKAPLLLTAIEGRSQAEAAGLLGVSVKTVETRVARARRKLYDALGDTTAARGAPE